ncbi:MAG: hypothetical protein ACXABG_07730 [Promethearchaeota archaeon]|jgi:hypothetical protein
MEKGAKSRIVFGNITIPINEESQPSPESTFWKYLDCSNWIPGEIEIEEEIFNDYK